MGEEGRVNNSLWHNEWEEQKEHMKRHEKLQLNTQPVLESSLGRRRRALFGEVARKSGLQN